MYDNSALKIYIDGSALSNPGPGGIALVAEYPDNLDKANYEINEGYRLTTNNRMELLACIKALQWVTKINCELKLTRVIIITDSFYVYQNKDRAKIWKKSGWKNVSGRPVENIDLWALFISERTKIKFPLDIRWEAGKTRAVLKRVDHLAKEASKHPIKVDNGYKIGKVTASKAGHKKGSTLFSASGQEIILRIYRRDFKGSLSKGEWKITFTINSKDNSGFTEKYYAYLHTGSQVEVHRGHSYKVKFNNDSKYPIMEIIEEV